MQSTDSRRPDSETASLHETDTAVDDAFEGTDGRRVAGRFEHRWATRSGRGLQAGALLLWIVVGNYIWFRSTQPAVYTVVVVGATLGLTLAVGLFGPGDQRDLNVLLGRQSTGSRLLTGGCLVGVVAGSLALVGSLDQLGASQPALSIVAVGGGVLLGGSLLVIAARQSRALAGFAAVAAAVSVASAPSRELASAAVFGSSGIYGPLTEAAVTWIAPACLLVGWWRAAGTEQQLSALWRASVDGWATKPPAGGRLIGAVGCMLLLVGWQTGAVGSRTVVGLAAVPVGLVGVASLHAVTRDATVPESGSRPSTATDRRWTEWVASTVIVGGPLGVMAVIAVGYRLPVGATLVAGCLCCLGLSVARPLVSPAQESEGRTSGVGTVLAGSVVGLQLLTRVVVPVMVVGGAVGLIDASGVGTRLLAGVVWLSGGSPLAAVVVVASCCVALGALLPLVGGYAAGALVGVPLLRLLGSVPELTAHVLVILGVVTGWLVAEWLARTTDIMSTLTER